MKNKNWSHIWHNWKQNLENKRDAVLGAIRMKSALHPMNFDMIMNNSSTTQSSAIVRELIESLAAEEQDFWEKEVSDEEENHENYAIT